eukprot:TRINITY_DN66744_c0_g1_i2.p1 TRINITY_DN66744_c0_g1~~TRINITY_DN66744_c0_g1_i2.p1  ORF type:complete len:187 (-),score=12.17 TRINITY_DN66744_c0_g1_i2:51-611(-)
MGSAVEYYTAFSKAGLLLVVFNIIIVLAARYVNVGICSLFVNPGRKRMPIGAKFQFLIWYSGLRGTIAYILALQCSIAFAEGNGNVIVLITIIFALFTLFIQSSFLNPILDYCDVKAKPGAIASSGPQLEETGCCADLKHALAFFDTFYMKKNFIISKKEQGPNESEMPATELKETHAKLIDKQYS